MEIEELSALVELKWNESVKELKGLAELHLSCPTLNFLAHISSSYKNLHYMNLLMQNKMHEPHISEINRLCDLLTASTAFKLAKETSAELEWFISTGSEG